MSAPRRPSRFSSNLLQQAHLEEGLEPGQPAASAPAGEAVLLDHGQEDIWFFEQFTPDALVHQVALVVDIAGPLARGALTQAVRDLVHRHEALRARFPAVNGIPRLAVAGDTACDMMSYDFAGLPYDQALRTWREVRDREVHRPFDLAAGPVARFTLARLAPLRHELLIAVHHIAADGHALAVLQRDLVAGYRAAADGPVVPAWSPDDLGRVIPGDPSRVIPGDLGRVITERRARAGQPALAERLERKLAELADLPAAAERWPSFGRATPDGADPHAAGLVELRLPAALSARVRSAAAAERSTPFMVWLAALAVLVQRMSGTGDVVIGTVLDGRQGAAAREIAGFLANVAALRIRLPAGSTGREVLGRARDAALAGFDCADIPFHRVVERLGLERRADVHPVFQIMLTPVFPLDPPVTVGEVTFSAAELPSRRSLYELEFQLGDHPGGTEGRLRYQRRFIDQAMAQAIADRFVRLVGELMRRPDDPVSALDRQEPGATSPAAVRPPERAVHQVFERIAEAAPGVCAIECAQRRVTYRALDDAANRLAHRLRQAGVGSESRVGLLMTRTIDWAGAALAVLKAGGCYVPLDPAWPPAWLAAVCADAQLRLVVDDGSFPAASAAVTTPVIRAEEGIPAGRTGLPCHPRRLACLSYTVGPAGRPLARAVEHRALAWLPGVGPLSRARVVAQAAGLATDTAALEIWGTLLNGGCLVALQPDDIHHPDRLASRVRASGIDVLVAPAFVAHRLAREAPDAVGGLRDLVVAGEQPDLNALRRLAAGGPVRIHLAYGTAECGTVTALHPHAEGGTARLGTPVAGSRWHVLDQYLHPVPPGGRGQLYLGGAGISRGYHRSPALTADRFVPDPFGEPGSRLYRPGDLVLRRGDGALEFLGREDRQGRVTGRRVDPGAVEAVLLATPGVSDAVVQIRRRPDGQAHLAGHVVLAPGGTAESVRRHALRQLPSWFVPDVLTELPAIPRNGRGEPDLTALPQPDAPVAAARRPRATATQERVLVIWQKVLELPGIGLDDNFFTIGGHSLTAVRAAAQLSAEFGVAITAKLLFDCPTVAATAAAIDALATADDDAQTPIRAVRRGRRPLTELLAGAADLKGVDQHD